jgi:hypothetical protein
MSPTGMMTNPMGTQPMGMGMQPMQTPGTITTRLHHSFTSLSSLLTFVVSAVSAAATGGVPGMPQGMAPGPGAGRAQHPQERKFLLENMQQRK